MPTIQNRIESQQSHIVELRHDLHAHPQVAFEETYASELIQRELTDVGVPFQAGLATTGVVGWLLPTDPAAAKRKAIALRADIDALAMGEETDLPYASQNPGCMHACGHDGHTAILLGVARVLADMRDALPRPVKFFFQPAEEGGGGAKYLIADGALDADVGGCEVGAAFALHGFPIVPQGNVAVRSGEFMARVDAFRMTIDGHGAHAAAPHLSCDPILAAAQIVTALQSILGRNVNALDKAVLSITVLRAGTASNVIPATAEILGTIRSFKDNIAELVKRRVVEISTNLAKGLGCEADIDFFHNYPQTVNDETATAFFHAVAADTLGADHVDEAPLCMGAEDFSYYSQRVPGCFARLGLGQPEPGKNPSLHNSTFDFNDDAIPVGMRIFCELALRSGELDIDG